MKLSQLRQIIREEIESSENNNTNLSDEEYEKLIKNAELIFKSEFNSAVGDIKEKVSNEKSKIQEAGAILTISVALALPAILGLVARVGKKMSQLYSKISGKKPDDNTEYIKWLDGLAKTSDDLHHLYIKPIEMLVSKFVKDKNKAHKISNIIMHVIIAIFLYSSGVGTLNAFNTKNYSLATIETALTAVKSGEIKSFLAKILDSVDELH